MAEPTNDELLQEIDRYLVEMVDLTKLTNDELLQEIDPLRADVGAEIMRRLEMNGITYRREDGERIYPTEEELNEIAKRAYMFERPEIFGKKE